MLVKIITALNSEMGAFRAEMQEFKKTVEKRIDILDSRQSLCQMNPASCANARKLEEHIKSDAGKAGRATGIIACVLSCFNMLVTVVTIIARGL